MAKYSGIVGIVIARELEPGIWGQPETLEYPIKGDLLQNRGNTASSDTLNGGFEIANRISFIPSKELMSQYANIKYVSFMQSKWEVSSVEITPPRLIVTLGGIWHD